MATYYLDATGGADTNDGLSAATAWQTIAKLNATTFAAGDTVLLKRGSTWTGTGWTVKASGAFTIDAYGSGALPIIDGNNLITHLVDFSSGNGAVGPTIVRNVSVRNATDGGAMRMTAQTAPFLISGCQFQGNAYVSNGGALLVGGNSGGSSPNWFADTQHALRSIGRDNNGIAFGASGRITGCTFTNNANDAIWCADTPDLEIDHNTITGVSSSLSDGIQMDGTTSGVTGRYCSNYWIHHNNIDMTGTNSAKGCITTNQQVAGTAYYGGLIEYNTCNSGNWGVSGSNSGCVVQYNTITNCVPGTQPNQGCLGTAAATGFHTDSQTFRYNVCVNCARGLYFGPSSWGPTNILAYGNVHINGEYRTLWCETGTTGQIFNNIIYGKSGVAVSALMRLETAIVDDYNILFPEYTSFINVQGTNYSTMAAYHTAGRGLHSLSSDPLFTTALDGHVDPSSPALGAGKPVAISGTGFQGDQNPFATAPFIGAFGGTAAPLTAPGQGASWIDSPSLITGGILVGVNGDGGSASTNVNYSNAQSTSKANRTIFFSHSDYSPIVPPTNLNVEHDIMTGVAFPDGKPHDMLIGILGFDGFTTGWPAGGLSAFTNGSMDSTLQSWCNLLNTLPPKPVIIRLWREMVSTSTIYGPAGASTTPNAGVNETSTTYVAAWKYVVSFIRERCPYVRFMWCPDAGNARALSSTTPYYPGDAYVDWVGVDAYVGGPTLQITANLAPLYGGFNTVSGTVARKPFMVAETQIDRADPSRLGDIADYTQAFSNMSGIYAVGFWDAASGGQYEIVDTPVGYVAEFQKVVGTAPFLGVVNGMSVNSGYTPPTGIGYVQELGRKAAGVSGTSVTVTLAYAPTAGNLLVARAACSGGQAVTSVTDSKGNTWTVDAVGTAGPKAAICSTGMNIATLAKGDTVTFNFSGTAGQSAAIIDEFTGCLTSSSRVDQTATGTATLTSRAAGTTLATTQAHELVVACFAGGAAETTAFTVGAGYTSFFTPYLVDTGTTVEGEYAIVSATGTQSPTATGVSMSTDGVVVTYKGTV